MGITTSEYYVGLGFSAERAETLSGHVARMLVDTDISVDTEILESALRTFSTATAGKGFGAAMYAAGVKDVGAQGSGRDYKKLVYNLYRSQFWASADGTKVTVEGATAPKRAGKTAWSKPSSFDQGTVAIALHNLVGRITAINPDDKLPDVIVDTLDKLAVQITEINSAETAKRIASALESVEAKRLAASPTAQAANVWQRIQMVAGMYAVLPATVQASALADARTSVTDAQRQDSDFVNALSVMGSGSEFVKAVLAVETVETAQ